MDARKPDYRLTVYDKAEKKGLGEVGAAWKNEDGSVTITLNAFVNLSYNPRFGLRLWPIEKQSGQEVPRDDKKYFKQPYKDDNVPF